MTDPTSPEIQAIFAQLHALGVTPEQAAAGLHALREPRLFEVGDRVLLARMVKPDGTQATREDWRHVVAPLLGQVGTVGKTDYACGGDDNTEVRVDITDDSYAYAWVSHEALDLIEPNKETT